MRKIFEDDEIKYISENKVLKNLTNKTVLINKDIKEELLYNIEPEGVNSKIGKCPEIKIKLETEPAIALINAGSEII